MDEQESLKERIAALEENLRETEHLLSDLRREDVPGRADAVRVAHMQQQLFLDASPNMYFLKDTDLRYQFINKANAAFFGREKEDIVGKTDAELMTPEAAATCEASDLRALREQKIVVSVEELGTETFETRKFPVRIDGHVSGVGGIIHDITKRKMAELVLEQSKERFELAMAATNDGLWDWNLVTGVCYFDHRYYTMAGYEPDEFPASFDEWGKRVHPDDLPLCSEMLHAHLAGKIPSFDMEFRFLRKNGTWMWIRGRGKSVESDAYGNVARVIGTHIDITELKRQREEIELLSFHDHLTGLYNRRFFDEELARLDTARNLPLTLLLMDVNGLKLTNDAFGHQAGDRLLRGVARVLRRTCREDEIIARIGGDEFIVLLPRTTEEDADSLCVRLKRAFAAVEIETGSISVACGLATKTNISESAGDIFITAENRMYQNKIYEMDSVRSKAISFIMKTLYEKIPREQAHSENVSKLAGLIGSAMGLEPESLEELAAAAKFHDIGKIAIGSDILDKPCALNDNEWLAVRRHPEIGYFILNSVSDYAPFALIALAHQERFDGTGYPKGLSGYDIPLHARIIAVTDAFDAMIDGRPYRPAKTPASALQEIRSGAGSQFDPEIVEVFLSLFPGDCGK